MIKEEKIMLNHATYCGRLTKDVVLQKVNVGSQQRSVCRFDIAVERDRKDKNGEYVADYFKCEVWGNSADYLANYAGKGTMVTVEGRTETNTYTSKTGQNVKDYVLKVSSVSIVSRSSKSKDEEQPAATTQQTSVEYDDSQFNDIDISDDDMPF
jgi:single-strand DNA-binding protein